VNISLHSLHVSARCGHHQVDCAILHYEIIQRILHQQEKTNYLRSTTTSKQPVQEFVFNRQSTNINFHQRIGILSNQQFYKSRKSTDVKTFIFKNTSTFLPANTFYENTYSNIHDRTKITTTTHATQLNRTETQRPHTTTQRRTLSHNSSLNHEKQRCHVPLRP
jgi:hypothetical protein